MTNKNNSTLYTGVTNDLQRRIIEHKSGKGGSFTKIYNINKLVYFETGDKIHEAIEREKQIKAGSRQNKLDLINAVNPEWNDLFEEMYD
jgi:putative endonuclease